MIYSNIYSTAFDTGDLFDPFMFPQEVCIHVEQYFIALNRSRVREKPAIFPDFEKAFDKVPHAR